MAKRARGTARPGQRRPIDRRPTTTAPAAKAAVPPTPRPVGLSDAELERAAAIEAELLAQEKAAEQSRQRTRERTSPREVVAGTGGSLAARAEAEYAYVARDVKDIVRIASLLLGILLLLWILVDVLDLIPIGN